MKILALDTSTEACSAALWINEEARERFRLAANRHSQLLLPMIEDLLSDAELKVTGLDAIAFGEGPGSFTGLRIGAGVAQGLALGADLPVVPVSSLHAQASRHAAGNVLSAIDARMGQVYWCLYQRPKATEPLVAAGPIKLTNPEDLRLPGGGPWLGVGTGCERYRETILANNKGLLDVAPGCYPHALEIGRIARELVVAGETLPPEAAVPHYVREQVTG